MERIVKGIWIPIDIWQDKNLSWNEKILLMEIDSYTAQGKECYISNEYVASLLTVAERTASRYLNNLINLGYIKVVKFDGRMRYVKSTLTYVQADWTQLSMQGGSNCPHTINKNTYKSSLNREDNSPKAFNFKKALIEIGVSDEVASAWMEVRKRKRATNSEIAFAAVRREITKSGMAPDDAIRLAVEKSWSGFDSSWLDKEKKVAPKRESMFEHNVKVMDKMFGTDNHSRLYKNNDIDEQ